MEDQRIGALEQRVTEFSNKLAENTKLTQEVLDTLRAFKMIGTLAKWGTIIIGFFVAMYHGAQAVLHFK